MADLYTKAGRPLQRRGKDLVARSGKHVARVDGNRAYGPDGHYVGTIEQGRLVYRATDSVMIWAPFVPMIYAPFVEINQPPAAILGQEPPIPS